MEGSFLRYRWDCWQDKVSADGFDAKRGKRSVPLTSHETNSKAVDHASDDEHSLLLDCAHERRTNNEDAASNSH